MSTQYVERMDAKVCESQVFLSKFKNLSRDSRSAIIGAIKALEIAEMQGVPPHKTKKGA